MSENNAILIVEDDIDIRAALADVLTDEGYAVLTASNGEEGLARLEEGPLPGLILLDLMMPVLNGWQFRREQIENERWRTIPVVVVSADAAAGKEAEEMGAADYLQKPVDLASLLDTVARFVPLSE